MGMFDSVWITCPNCGGAIESQSKAGECELRDYTLSDAPARVKADLDGYVVTCPDCERSWVLRVQALLTVEPTRQVPFPP